MVEAPPQLPPLTWFQSQQEKTAGPRCQPRQNEGPPNEMRVSQMGIFTKANAVIKEAQKEIDRRHKTDEVARKREQKNGGKR